MKRCVGCLNIKKDNFPFLRGEIDMEGCGVYLNGRRMDSLKIIYCPVCGKKLEE